MKIGVFDSGIGGLSVVKAIELALPEYEVVFANDTKNVPYGTKSPDELLKLVTPILKELVDKGCEVIVIACNTVSTTLITELRQIIKVPLIAMEPMVKPAAQDTKTKIIAICATPTTLASKRYAELKSKYAQGLTVLEPDCRNWVLMIEHDSINRNEVEKLIDLVCDQGADVIVLGCTHYHWIEDIVTRAAKGRAKVLQPEQPVIEQLKKVIGQLS
jgi:glutamate racemase